MIDTTDLLIHVDSCEDLANAATNETERTKWEGRAKLFLLRATVHELRNLRETIAKGVSP